MRRLALFCGGFAAGIFLAQYALPDGWLLPGASACLGAGIAALLLPAGVRKRAVLCLTGTALALGWNWLYVRQVSAPMESLEGSRQTLTMTLTEYPTETRFGAKVTVRAEGLPGKLLYSGDETLLLLAPGQQVTDDVYLQSAARIRDDDVTVFNSKGVFLLAGSRGTPSFGEENPEALRWLPARLGHAMQERIRTLFDGDDAGFLLALLTGKKGELSAQAEVDLSEAGVYHILAVSGMHCACLLGLVLLLTGRHRRRLAAAMAIPALIFYAALTGASPSVVRACVMLSLLTAAPLFRRENDPPTALLTALFLILAANPFAAKSVSLQLSFGAVAGLLWLSPEVYRLLAGTRHHGRVFTAVMASVSATTGCLALTAPVSAYYFGFFAPVGFLSNLLCLWAVGILFGGALAAVLLSFVWMPLGMIAGLVPRLLIRYILTVCHVLAGLPYHAVYFCNPCLKWWMAFAYLLFAAVWLGKPVKKRRSCALAAALCIVTLASSVSAGQSRFRHRLDAAAVDVGQGQSVILKSGGSFALVDCGSGNSWRDAGCDAADQLLAMGCRTVNRVILTHFDDDHINGVEHLLARIPVETLTVPPAEESPARTRILELAAQYGVTVETVAEKRSLPLGDAEVTLFPPLGRNDSNERGLSVLASAGESDFLVTGDMERATEKLLAERYDLPDAEVLMAGHHGSADSTSEELLEGVTPETVIISVGSNAYGHPAEPALRRMARAGCSVYRTDHHGTVFVSFD